MLDPANKGSESEEMSSNSQETESPLKKTCADCGTSKTPLWRGGPAGPKSLCNACGIRSRKKKRDILGLNKGAANDKRAKKGSNNNGSSNNNNNKQLGDGSKQRLLALGREVLMQRRKLGEEEQAAVLLMALSYGSVYA
ncbi:hypothetical protein POPTR_008G213900v4 [Populus trichocarpa]|uniref:GATA-type domain-containing protein n=1 Tax=Populus trichocarpa TaxID=3694 RepID=U5G6U8_POPTR|nr:GATA transcription factor 15 [Populus trichocarpa]KAI5581023.1 hypothetical protein BDE02_08G193100 [Populus trichocarpa]PNT25992.1 hypothetical protein POPTR_008G213900v4 [Populus trichocarpa]|eukprot:XP_006380209.1 GATA transcription factor 15 [Populus trichocarpa]